MVGGGDHVGLATMGDVKALDGLGKCIGSDLALADVKKFDGAVHAGAGDGGA